jgi:hypothetical protein
VQTLVSVYGSNGDGGPSTAGFTGDPAVGAIPPEQATLYRQARLVVGDARPILAALQPRSSDVDAAEVMTLRSQVDAEFTGLLEEFGRLDGPRTQKVDVYLRGLVGATGTGGHVEDFATLIQRDPSAGFTSLDEERQDASVALIRSHARSLATFWAAYLAGVGLDTASGGPGLTFAERLSRASQLLTAVTETNNNFLAAMDAVGYSENERRLDLIEVGPLALGTPGSSGLSRSLAATPAPSLLTIGNLTAWLDEYGRRGAGYLERSGQFGLEFVITQAEALFWVVSSLVGPRSAANPLPPALADDRVRQELENLLAQLDLLADLDG